MSDFASMKIADLKKELKKSVSLYVSFSKH